LERFFFFRPSGKVISAIQRRSDCDQNIVPSPFARLFVTYFTFQQFYRSRFLEIMKWAAKD
jgi:hypothetical protein